MLKSMSDLLYRDGHIHSPFCPHGTPDKMELYVEEALKHNLKEMSFTEHMAFPCYFIEDKEFLDECATPKEKMQDYFDAVKEMQKKYKGKIKINTGMEVDFIDGLEDETKKLLDLYGPKVQDSILSVHFIKTGNKITAIDWEPGFKEALEYYKSVEKVYDAYFETLLKAVESDKLGKYKPKRIGHPNLIRRFCEIYPCDYKNYELIEKIAKAIKERDYEVDVNTAGLRKKGCGEIYTYGFMNEMIKKYNIKKVYGSDSHTASDVARDFDKADELN